ncbi:hypothetical protein [Streptomyces sp. YGL11-2]|uniref:hypothetical protein n=1 Tax=Streptomyces sp. YGL11-2 TaxID=3414028 RepID=UPI003CF1B3F3
MTRHHLIPWNVLRDSWNNMAKRYYGTQGKGGVPKGVMNYLKVLRGSVAELPFNPELTPEEKRELRDLLQGLIAGEVEHQEGGTDLKMGVEKLTEMICWTSGNLIIGPSGPSGLEGVAYRVDDPGENIEPDLGRRLQNPDCLTAAEELKKIASVTTGGTGGDAEFGTFFSHLRTLSLRVAGDYPQGVREQDWRHIARGGHFLPSNGSGLITKNSKEAVKKHQGTLVNNTGMILRQVEGRGVPVTIGLEVEPVAVSAIRVADIDPVVKIGEKTFLLEVVAEDLFHKQWSVSATGIKMSDVLDWASGKWKSSPFEVPDFVRKLELRQLTVKAETAHDFEAWQVCVGTQSVIAGVDMSMVFYLEYVKKGGFGLGALVSCVDGSSGNATPLCFSGDFSKDVHGWQFEATGGPFSVAALVRALGVKSEDLPPELTQLLPDKAEAELRCRFTETGAELAASVKAGNLQTTVACLKG